MPAPTSEQVARELAPLRGRKDALPAAWAEVVDIADGKPTARDVRVVVRNHDSTDARTTMNVAVYTICPACGRKVQTGRPHKRPARNMTRRNLQMAEAAKLRIHRLMGTCGALNEGLPHLKIEMAAQVSTADELDEWRQAIDEGIRGLQRLKERIP